MEVVRLIERYETLVKIANRLSPWLIWKFVSWLLLNYISDSLCILWEMFRVNWTWIQEMQHHRYVFRLRKSCVATFGRGSSCIFSIDFRIQSCWGDEIARSRFRRRRLFRFRSVNVRMTSWKTTVFVESVGYLWLLSRVTTSVPRKTIEGRSNMWLNSWENED